MSAVVALENHFTPWSRQPSPSARATVSLSPTSEPPVRSVIHCPEVHMRAGSRLVRRGMARSMSAALPCATRVRAAPSVIARGHEYTSVDGLKRCTRANWSMREYAP